MVVALSRTISERTLKMQVLLPRTVDGRLVNLWHRQMLPDLVETSCELPITRADAGYQTYRRESLEPENNCCLCPFCFTPAEIRRSLELQRKAEAKRLREVEEWQTDAARRREENDRKNKEIK